MKSENKLRFMSLLFSLYSFIITFLVAYFNLVTNGPMSWVDISVLLTAGVSIFMSILADIISISR